MVKDNKQAIELSNLCLLCSLLSVGFLMIDCSSIIERKDTIAGRLLAKN